MNCDANELTLITPTPNRNEAIDTIFSFRQQLGLPILKNKPASPLIIIKEFIKTKRALGNKTAEDIASLPELTDDRIIMGQRMLELACTSSFQVSVVCTLKNNYHSFAAKHLLTHHLLSSRFNLPCSLSLCSTWLEPLSNMASMQVLVTHLDHYPSFFGEC